MLSIRVFRQRFCGLVGVALAAALSLPLRGQVSSAALGGEVRDTSAAVVPGVEVTARNLTSGFARTVTTNGEGLYRIDNLPPGTYTVAAAKAGFRPLNVTSVALEINQKGRLDLTLEVGASREAITVTASISPLQTDEASEGYRLDHSTFTSLPLAVRNVFSLVTLGPGAIPRQLGGFVHDTINDVQEGSRGSVALNPPINGSRSYTNVYLMDGSYNTDRNTFAIAVNPPMDSVQEFRIQSSLAPAEFAQGAGGVIDVVTRSGGRQFHGNAFEYFRNEATDAQSYFADPALPRPLFRQNQFGGSAGGPVPGVPSTFFFATYEGLRGKNGNPTAVLVPDTALRSGDFTGRNPIFDPLSLDPVTHQRLPFANNQIPGARIDPIARNYLAKYEPLPNRSDPNTNYIDSTPSQFTDDSVTGRIDHEFAKAGLLFGRYTLNSDRNLVGGTFPVLPDSDRLRAQQALIGHTWAGASWVNETRFSFTRLRLFDVPESAFKTNVAADLGLKEPPTDPFTFGLPYFLVTNFSTVTDSPTLPQTQRDNTWNLNEGVTYHRGRGTWKFGFQWIHFDLNYLQSNYARGQYTYTGAFSSNGVDASATGDPFADFLLGFPQNTNRTAGSTQSYMRQNAWAGYIQQDWRVTDRLTLNFGIRYEYASPYTEKQGRLLNLDYSTLPKAPQLVPVDSAARPDRNDFAPRVGLAWRLPSFFSSHNQTVFRAGYGIYYSPEIALETYDLLLNGTRNEINTTNGSGAPVLTTFDGFPQTASTGFPSYYGLDPNVRTPYIQQWNAGIQHSFSPSLVLEVAYIGSKGTKLGRFRRFNTPAHVETGENLPPRPGDLQSLRTFPELGTIFQRQHIANSSYNSLQIKAEKRFSGRLSFIGSFVWSKSIDDADAATIGLFDSVGAQDERNLRLERGLSFFNAGRRVSGGAVYNLPSSQRLKPVLSNWQISGIVTLQDGTPLNSFFFATDYANSGTPNRPDIVPGQSINLPRDQRTVERFFNTDAFAAPAPYHFGNAGRDIVQGPGNNIFDIALHRYFAFGESKKLEFRVESFNAFNHPNWGIPVPNPDFGPFFGRIVAVGDPRRFQFATRFEF